MVSLALAANRLLRCFPIGKRAQLRSLDMRCRATARTGTGVRVQLRQAITEWWHLPTSVDAQDLLIAVGEAVTNAWKHGCSGKRREIRVKASFDGETRVAKVEVIDPGPGFDPSTPFRRETLDGVCACGRFLMHKCADSVSYERRDGHFVCTVTKRF